MIPDTKRPTSHSGLAKFGSPLVTSPEKQAEYGSLPNASSLSSKDHSPSMLGAIGVDPSTLVLSKKNTEMVMRPMVHTPTLTRVFSRVEPGSLRGSIFTLSSSAIGAGVLSLPLVMRNTGLILGGMLCITGAILALFSMNMLVDTAEVVLFARGMTGSRAITYSELVTQILGEKWGVALEVTLVVYCFGTIVGYLLVIGKAIGGLCDAMEIGLPSPGFPIILAAFLALPLALFRDISSLALSSMLAICAMIYVCMSITYRGLQAGSLDSIPTPTARIEADFCSSATIVFFAYNCHVNIFSIYSSLQYPLVSRMKKVTQRAVALELSLYLCVASSGYLLFHDETKGNILQNFPPSDLLITIGKGGIATALTASLPLCLHPARENFYSLINKCFSKAERRNNDNIKTPLLNGTPNSRLNTPSAASRQQKKGPALWFHVLVTLSMMFGALYLALNVPGVSIVFSFLGATACIIICYAMPIIMYISILEHRSILSSRCTVMIHKLFLWLLLAVLVIVGVISASSSAMQIAMLFRGEEVAT